MRENQKVIKNDNDELIVKNYPTNKKELTQQQPKYKHPDSPTCKRNSWINFYKGWYCEKCE